MVADHPAGDPVMVPCLHLRQEHPDGDSLSVESTSPRRAIAWVVDGFLSGALGGRAVGWSFALRNGEEEIATVAGGWARAPWEATAPKVAMTVDSRMHLASISKLITNVALRALIEDWNWARQEYQGVQPWPPELPQNLRPGLTSALVARALQDGQDLSLDRPVIELIGSRIPNPGTGVESMTLRNLLNHSSGIDLDGVNWADGGMVDSVDLWGGIAATFARGIAAGHTPGDGFPGYRNEHYVILRAVIEELTGVTYENHVQTRVWGKAGTAAPSCRNSDAAPVLYYGPQALVPATDRTGSPRAGAHWPDYANRAGAFGWYASARDVAKLLAAVRDGNVLSSSATQEFLQQRDGVMTFSVGAATGIGHNGGWGTNGGSFGGCCATFDNGLSAVLLVNSDAAVDATDLFWRVLELCQPELDVDPSRWIATNVTARNPFGSGDLRITTDGTLPTPASPLAGDRIVVESTALTITATLFDGPTPVSFPAGVVAPLPAIRPAVSVPTSPEGLNWRMRQGEFDRVPGFCQPGTVSATGTNSVPDKSVAGLTENYALEFVGYVIAPADGVYAFGLNSDDGSRLVIGDSLVIDNDGLHPPTLVSGAMRLAAGAHPFALTFVQGGAGATLELSWSGPGFGTRAVVASDFRQMAGEFPPAVSANQGERGLRWRIANTFGDRVPEFGSTIRPIADGASRSIDLASVSAERDFAVEWTGLLSVPADGTYRFDLSSDDGSRLWVGPHLVVDNDGLHGTVTVAGEVALRAGLHRLRLGYFQRGGGESLALTWTRPGSSTPGPLDAYLFQEN
jgi:CubicO group peptidase (beta-lactamase class C family)